MLYLCIQIDFSSGFRAIHQILSFHHFFLWRRAVVLISRQVASPAVVIRSSGGPPVTVTSTSTEKVQVLYRRLSHVRQQWMRRRSSVVGDLDFPVKWWFRGGRWCLFFSQNFETRLPGCEFFSASRRGVISGFRNDLFWEMQGMIFLGGGFKDFLFSPLLGEMIKFD